ncbi:MAG: DUF6588 family protein [Bacteroidota bacterium]
MKKLIYTASFLLIASGLITSHVSAQSDMSLFLRTGLNDGNKLLDAYSTPLLKSFGAGLNAGWFNTAKVHGLGGFDITIAPNITFAPKSDQTFDFNTLGLSSQVRLAPGQGNTFQSVFGSDKKADVELVARYPGSTQDSARRVSLPGGIGLNLFVVPTAQIAVGIGFGTEIAIRFLPQVGVSDAKIGMFGFAVKHDFKRWIPAIKELPFDLSAMFGYTSMNASVKATSLQADGQSRTTYNPNPGKSYSQETEFTSSAYTFNVLLSKKIAFFTPYLGLGYQAATTTLKLKGEYPVTDINSSFDPTYGGTGVYDPSVKNHHPQYVNEIKDPISIDGKLSGARATLGFRLKFGPMTFHTDYTFAEYDVASIGLGVNIQALVPFKL